MTNIELIADALRQIGVLDENEAPSAEQGEQGLRRLNQLMATWAQTDLTFPSWFPQTSQSEECPIPDWAELAVTSALSIALAGAYGVSVSEELVAIADGSRYAILRTRINQQLQPIVADVPGEEAGPTWLS
ncbi:MAG: hypothetical protein IT480_06500 [Gammaproteobacteria bacterium]|nr:hypothetical protein [Gammaproteobacteria bacterium]